jgi:hypothetical protein
LAEARLTLQELETPAGRKLDDKIKVEMNLDKWKLMWNGHDVVQRVVHRSVKSAFCLSFLSCVFLFIIFFCFYCGICYAYAYAA